MAENSILNIEQNAVAFTNERLVINKEVKENFKEVVEEHINRYELASNYVKGKVILDGACGAGYGSKMLKEAGAESVTGVDISSEAVIDALKSYSADGISFECGDVNKTRFKDKSFDVVVSFETIEHIDKGQVWIEESARILKEKGIYIVSTPNRMITNHLKSFRDKVRNPYHKYEYTLSEFIGELSLKYDIVDIYGQTFIPNKTLSSHFTNFKILKYYYTNFVSGNTSSGGGISRILSFLSNVLKKKETVAAVPIVRLGNHEVKALSEVKDMQPMYIIAVCRKKSEV
jgi:ubiquinone/menaquinone biosynthesis C-methylase UbiE